MVVVKDEETGLRASARNFADEDPGTGGREFTLEPQHKPQRATKPFTSRAPSWNDASFHHFNVLNALPRLSRPLLPADGQPSAHSDSYAAQGTIAAIIQVTKQQQA